MFKNKVVRKATHTINQIPEPTRSLLWVTDENPSMAVSAMGYSIEMNISSDGEVKTTIKEKGLNAEPSMIWTRLPVEPNDRLTTDTMYWPTYFRLDPDERYQYLNWLTDISQQTNLSYVFLYFYGLERHLLTGNYDEAVSEILRLIKNHSKSSFRAYATNSLIAASIINKRPDILDKAPHILTEETNEALALRILQGTTITAEDVISISSKVGFKNKRYIKLYPNLFKSKLQILIHTFEAEHGEVLKIFRFTNFKSQTSSAFANLSIPEKFRMIRTPDILGNKDFKSSMFKLLQKAHDDVKSVPDKKEAEAEAEAKAKDKKLSIEPTKVQLSTTEKKESNNKVESMTDEEEVEQYKELSKVQITSNNEKVQPQEVVEFKTINNHPAPNVKSKASIKQNYKTLLVVSLSLILLLCTCCCCLFTITPSSA